MARSKKKSDRAEAGTKNEPDTFFVSIKGLDKFPHPF
jgi:hypothetical protein